MRKLLFLVVTTLMFIVSNLQATMPPDSCLKMYSLTGYHNNPDSIMIDSCAPVLFPSRPIMYARRFWYLCCKYNIIPRSQLYPCDTIIEYTWRDIDTNYTQARADLASIEQKFGPFWLREIAPCGPDTTADGALKRDFRVRFEQRHRVEEVEDSLSKFSFVDMAMYLIRIDSLFASVSDDNVNIKTVSNIITKSKLKSLIQEHLLTFPEEKSTVSLWSLTCTRTEINDSKDINTISALSAGWYMITMGRERLNVLLLDGE